MDTSAVAFAAKIREVFPVEAGGRRTETLVRVLDDITPPFRRLLLLVYGNGKTVGEAAAETGVSLEEVRSQLKAARRVYERALRSRR